MLGVIGGMGPLATVDFLEKLVQAAHALRDRDHVPVVMWSDPRNSGCSDAIMAGSDAPLTNLRDAAHLLCDMGAGAIAIPCNSAHHWADAIADAIAPFPLLDIVDAVIDALEREGIADAPVGLLGTPSLERSGFYESRLAAHGFSVLYAAEDEQQRIMDAIHLVKAGDPDAARFVFEAAADGLAAKGAKIIVLACSEIPIVLRQHAGGPRLLDATDALATSCVHWWRQAAARG